MRDNYALSKLPVHSLIRQDRKLYLKDTTFRWIEISESGVIKQSSWIFESEVILDFYKKELATLFTQRKYFLQRRNFYKRVKLESILADKFFYNYTLISYPVSELD